MVVVFIVGSFVLFGVNTIDNHMDFLLTSSEATIWTSSLKFIKIRDLSYHCNGVL